MKLHKILMALAVAAASAGFVSCDDDFDRPPVIVPEATITANTSILDLKAKYWQDSSQDYQTTIGTTDDGKHIIIGGRVVSSDKEGNVYQRIILEDETSAITVRIYSTDLYEKYQYGQEVRIDVTGLLIGTYRGLQMIGTLYNNSIGGMDLDVFTSIAQVNGLPDPALIPEYVTTIPDVMAYKANQQEMMTWQTRLITLNDVEFVGGGSEMFGTPGAANYTTRKLRDAQGNTIDISTSNKCKFVSTVMPSGKGSVRAILSYFGSNWQLVFSDPATDCTGFEWTDKPVTPGPGDTPAGEGTLESPYNAAKALELAKALDENGKIENVYVKGKVIAINEFSTQFGNATYTIGDSEGGTTISVYRGYGLNGDKFTSEDQLKAGDEVVVLGTLVNFKGTTPQITSGSKIVSLNGQGGGGGGTPDTPAGEGTEASPYNAAKALELAKALDENGKIENVYVKGKVISVQELSTQFGNATYTIGDSEGGVTFSIYRGKGLNGEKFTSEDQLQVGAEVVVLGTLVNYMGNTPQMTSGSQLVSYNGQGGTVTPGGGDTPSGEGTLESPYNAAKALDLAKALDENGKIENVYVKGKVASIKEVSTQFGNATYNICDTEGGETFSIYRGYGLNGDKFTAEDQLQVGAEVVVLGTLVNFKGNTPQMTTGSQIVSYENK